MGDDYDDLDDDDFARKHARASDPSTSHAAAEDDLTKRRDAAIVWAVFKMTPHPIADFELDAILGGSFDGKWRKRRCDFKDRGEIVDSGLKVINPQSNRQQIRWMIAPPASPYANLDDEVT